ncbi:MAG: ArsC/Spx/MgsR family protein, partial [Bacteroidota bacterium]
LEVFHHLHLGSAILQQLQGRGAQVEVVEYLKQPLTANQLAAVIRMLGISAAQLVRQNEAIYKEQFRGRTLSEQEWIEAMVNHPKLIERPIVVKGNKAVVGRPPEKVETLL